MDARIEILEECKISPPQNSVGAKKVSLTFFDMLWISAPAVERIMFYDFPHPTTHFIESILPQLKHSLSLALQLYFPLAGSLVCNPLPTEPYILYRDGDFVPLTVAQSNGDFCRLVGNSPKNVADFRPLVPYLSNEISSLVSDDGDDQVPIKVLNHLIALQVTIFPNSGISICVVSRHAIADGRTMTNFIKSWASLFKSRNDLSFIPQTYHDRATVIKDPNGLLSLMCKQWHELGISWDSLTTSTTTSTTCVKLEDKLHATFVLGSHQIGLMRNWIASRFEAIGEPLPLPYISTYVLIGALIWTSLVKSKFNDVTMTSIDNRSTDDSVHAHFGVLTDCTEKQELGVPRTYIGNCLSGSFASLMLKELVSENGFQLAAKAIMQTIKELETGIRDKVPMWLPDVSKIIWSSPSVTTMAGSPKLGIYETDFGWGKPKKVEAVHINKEGGSFTLAESRDEKGGVEVGISLSKIDMEVFTSIFELGLKKYVAA